MSQLLFIDAVEIMPVGISHQLCNLIDFHVRVHIQASGLLHPEPGDIVDKIDAHDLLEYAAEIIPAVVFRSSSLLQAKPNLKYSSSGASLSLISRYIHRSISPVISSDTIGCFCPGSFHKSNR